LVTADARSGPLRHGPSADRGVRPVADAIGAPVLGDQDRIGQPGQGKADHHGDLILIRDLRLGLFPQDRSCDLGE
jgi:hypothetical protein